MLVVAGVAILVLLAVALRPRGRNDLMAPPSSLARMAAPSGDRAAMPEAPAAPVTLSQDVQLKVWVELRDGRVINAVKLVRDSTGLGLKDAKDFVDALRRSDPELR